MPTIASSVTLEAVEHIEASGSGVLDFAVRGDDATYTWWGVEDADWSVEGVASVENIEEDRIIIYPSGDSFVCQITADGEEGNTGPVTCVSE